MYMIFVSINQIANKYGLYIRYIHNASINPAGVLSKKRHLDRLRSHYEPHRIQGEQLWNAAVKRERWMNIQGFFHHPLLNPGIIPGWGSYYFLFLRGGGDIVLKKNPMIRSTTLPWSSYVFGAIKTIQLDVTMFYVGKNSLKVWNTPWNSEFPPWNCWKAQNVFLFWKIWVQGLVDSLENSLSFWTWHLLWVS